MTYKKPNQHNMIESLALFTQHVKVCVCVCIICKSVHLGQNVKTHNHLMFQKQRNMIITIIFVLNGVQRNTQKHLRDILSWTWYAQHKTKQSTMHKNEEQTCETCKISIILTKPTKPIYHTHQNIKGSIFNNHIFKSQHKHKIQEN